MTPIKFTTFSASQIAARGSECRGRVKEFIRPVVIAHYGLKDIPVEKVRAGRKQRETVEGALENMAFIYKVPLDSARCMR